MRMSSEQLLAAQPQSRHLKWRRNENKAEPETLSKLELLSQPLPFFLPCRAQIPD
jgi:hypothetical protein